MQNHLCWDVVIDDKVGYLDGRFGVSMDNVFFFFLNNSMDNVETCEL